MAGDWIKVDCALPDKPEVIEMASILNIDQDLVVGKLVRLWIWADKMTENGHAPGVTLFAIDRICYAEGFGKALKKVGWLRGKDGSLTLPNFDRHNSKSAKARVLATERQRLRRHASIVTKALPEKRREEYAAAKGCESIFREAGVTSNSVTADLASTPGLTPDRARRVMAKVKAKSAKNPTGMFIRMIRDRDWHAPKYDAAQEAVAAFDAGVWSKVNGVDLHGKRVTHNSRGLFADGVLIVPMDQIREAVFE